MGIRLVSSLRSDRPEYKSFVRYLRSLRVPELAELIALMRLGRESELQPEDWNTIVQSSSSLDPGMLYEGQVDRLPQYIRTGMERLARFQTGKMKVVKPKEEPTPEQPGPGKPAPGRPALDGREVDRKRKALLGDCVVQAYAERYGYEEAMRRLSILLEEKGYLNNKAARDLFSPFLEDRDAQLDMELTLASSRRRIRISGN